MDLLFKHTLSHFEETGRGVTAFGTDGDGEEFVLEADYLVACDGGRSTIREQLGFVMQGASNPQPWLVIDTIDPYMDDDIVCRFYCDPKRPGMTLKKRHQERRWEWMLMPGDVIVTGSPEGVGVLRDPQVLLVAGDTVEVEVSGVGVLTNSVIDQPVA